MFSSFSEDMLPRHFPKIHRTKSLQPLNEAAIVIPQPTLPSVSLICSSENSVKSQQSLQPWNDRQYHATLHNDSMKHQAKSVKKHVRFVANNCDINRYISTERKDADVRSKLECSFLQEKHQSHPRHTKPFETFCLSPEEKRLPRSRFLPPRDYQHQFGGTDPSNIAHLQADNVGPRAMASEHRSQSHSSYEVLLNILEEQQHHISMQRNQILMQEKQNLEQQKEICMLEYQIQQLLLQKEVVQSYQPPFMNNASKTSMDFGCVMSEYPEDTNIDKTTNNFGISQVKNVALSSESFVFDSTYGAAASSAIFYNKLDETVSSMPHSFVCSGSSYGQSQLAMERSLVLNILRMKYKSSEVEKSLDGLSEKDNQFTDDDVSFEVYDYLVRHGLIKRRM